MMKRSLFLLVTVIGLGMILQSHKAEAAAIGQSCAKPGATGMSDDQRNAVMCLSDGSHAFVWKQLSVEPQAVADGEGKPVAHFENGGVVWNAPAPKSLPATTPATHALLASAPSRWEGFYAGGNFGVSYNSYNFDDLDYTWGGDRSVTNTIGLQPGVKVGYNWQLDRAVVGIEADYNVNLDQGQEHGGCMLSGGCSSFGQITKGGINSYGTLRGRAGILASDDILAYLTAGGVYARSDQKVENAGGSGAGLTQWKAAANQFGLTAGLGGEFALANHISIDGEFLHAFFLRDQVHGSCTSGTCGSTPASRQGVSPDMSIMRVGLNYHFN